MQPKLVTPVLAKQPEEAKDYLDKELVGHSQAICKTKEIILQVANTDSSILILGESGTGKEVISSCIHHLSERSNQPFVPINCGAIPGELMESELFGHEKGSFTGAAARRTGRFEIANHGTLFLDEIGDMPLNMQVKLLRVLQEKKIERVGSATSIDIDTRIISATNKHLYDMVTEGKFREDLYYRLNVIPIYVPNLVERSEDIPALIDQQLAKIRKRLPYQVTFNSEAIDTMMEYAWPGNIRELANFVERLVVIYHDQTITRQIVRDEIMAMKGFNQGIHLVSSEFEQLDLKKYLADIERELIQKALDKSNGIVATAAQFLSLRRTTLIEKIKKYNLSYG